MARNPWASTRLSVGISLSTNFTLKEATITQKGIDNSPSPEELKILVRTAAKMEQVRRILGNKPIIITSWFRNEAVNQAVGGVFNSQHRLGEAVDFVCPLAGNPSEVCGILRGHKQILAYDQLILEPSWVHISFLTNPADPRKTPRMQFLDLSRAKS